MAEHRLPGDIERSSMAIIRRELEERGVPLDGETAPVVLRVIHATADFEYVDTLRFSESCVRLGTEALRRGTPIVTDTNMALSGVSRAALSRLGASAFCYMAEPAVARAAKEQGTTRAAAAMKLAAREHPGAVLAVGNAPTALLEIARQMQEGLRPSLVIAVPVGFVNVVESKEQIVRTCAQFGVPCIAAMGRKGGSTVAAAICNALLYTAADTLDPEKRGWKG